MLLWALRTEKRREKQVSNYQSKGNSHYLKGSKHLFWEPQELIIIGQLLRRKQKARPDDFNPWSSEDQADFIAAAWSQLSLFGKGTKLWMKCLVHEKQLNNLFPAVAVGTPR